MPSAVIPISGEKHRLRQGQWSLLEVARPGYAPEPFAILLVDGETDRLYQRLRKSAELEDLSEQEIDILDLLGPDLQQRADEYGATALLVSLEDSLSNFLRISDRAAIAYPGNPEFAVNRLFDEHVNPEVRPWETHLPLYGLSAAATKFGDSQAVDEGHGGGEESWLRMREGLRLTREMFVARVVGRSMEPLILDGSLCVFRSHVTGSRKGRFVLIEKFGETDFAARYTVKRYTSDIKDSEDSWEHRRIRLEPLNKSFEAFDLGPDEFRVIAEFVEVVR